MITVNLSIILALSALPKPAKDTKQKKNDKGKGRNTKNTKSKKESAKSSKGKDKVKKEKSGVENINNTSEYDAAKPLSFAHIEYKLFPHKHPCQVDVKCWGTIAKVLI